MYNGLQNTLRARNRVVNNIGTGVVAGSPGTSPTAYQTLGANGLTRTVSFGVTALGEEYVDFRWNGTIGDANGIQIDAASGTTVIRSSTNWDECYSVGLALVGGDLTNINAIQLSHRFGDSAGTFISSPAAGSDIKSLLTSNIQRFTGYRRVTDVGVSFIKPRVNIAINNGSAVDLTLRVSLPQLERKAVASRIVRKSGTA